jgi:hypothetical protein
MSPSEKTNALVAALDQKLNARAGWDENCIGGQLRNLIQFGQVEVGWRESCGSTDRTHTQYQAWKRVIAALKKDGFQILEERQKHANSWATKSGGFWQSIVFKLEGQAA